MDPLLWVGLPLLTLYGLFLLWYGGRGRPLTGAEIETFMVQLAARTQGTPGEVGLAEVRQLLASDDGREFVMQNLVRYRAKAQYPPGYDFSDDARAADKRYGQALLPHLVRYGNLVLFVARCSGRFITPEGADDWHYVAMVRYRSRRDFVRFALASAQRDIFVHKWAAIEKTHVFPVQPIVSLFFVRASVALLLAVLGVAGWAVLH